MQTASQVLYLYVNRITCHQVLREVKLMNLKFVSKPVYYLILLLPGWPCTIFGVLGQNREKVGNIHRRFSGYINPLKTSPEHELGSMGNACYRKIESSFRGKNRRKRMRVKCVWHVRNRTAWKPVPITVLDVSRLVEENVTRVWILLHLRGEPVELLYARHLDFLFRKESDKQLKQIHDDIDEMKVIT